MKPGDYGGKNSEKKIEDKIVTFIVQMVKMLCYKGEGFGGADQ